MIKSKSNSQFNLFHQDHSRNVSTPNSMSSGSSGASTGTRTPQSSTDTVAGAGTGPHKAPGATKHLGNPFSKMFSRKPSLSNLYNPSRQPVFGGSAEHHPTIHRKDSFVNSSKQARADGANINIINEEAELAPEDYQDEPVLDEPVDPNSEEDGRDYVEGGYHPVAINELYGDRKNYKIVRKLGWGHFSTVWLAYDLVTLKHVAIKIVRSAQVYHDSAIDEIRILDIINSRNPSHPGFKHLVKLLDWFYHRGPNGKHVCMVFEVLGESLLGFTRNFSAKGHNGVQLRLANFEKTYGGLPVSVVKQIAKQALLALDYLHRECGLIHTDIKPENILVEINDVESFVKCLKSYERRASLSINTDVASSASSVSAGAGAPNSAGSCLGRCMRRSSSRDSPIKCSKPLPSPLTTTNVEFREYFDSVERRRQSSLTGSVSSKLSGSSSRNGSVSYYGTHSTHSIHSTMHDGSVSPTSQSRLSSSGSSQLVISAAERDDNSDDEQSSQPAWQPSQPAWSPADVDLASRFSSVSVEDEPAHSHCRTHSYSEKAHEKGPSHYRAHSYSENGQQVMLVDSDIANYLSIKIADLGNACYNSKHFSNEIQTRQYRSPEVILGHSWGCSADIWSLACLLFELLTDDFLFDPKANNLFSKDDDHLAQIMELLGTDQFTEEYLRQCRYATDFFESVRTKVLRKIKTLKFWDLHHVLIQKYKFEFDKSLELCQFLLPMLKVDPARRVDAGGWSNHPWLSDVKNDDFINRPVGCCGEDITGWDREAR